MDVHATLRQSTQERHERLDKSLRIGSGDANYTDYLAYIAALCGWLEPVESQLWARAWPASLQAEVRRGKASRIYRDFEAARGLGLEAPPVQFCDRLPDIARSRAYALGVMYVIEGSQLGGRMIAKRMEQAWPDRPFHYLSGYGPELGALWKSFTAFLAAELNSEEDVADAVDGARDAFDTLTDWLRQQRQ